MGWMDWLFGDDMGAGRSFGTGGVRLSGRSHPLGHIVSSAPPAPSDAWYIGDRTAVSRAGLVTLNASFNRRPGPPTPHGEPHADPNAGPHVDPHTGQRCIDMDDLFGADDFGRAMRGRAPSHQHRAPSHQHRARSHQSRPTPGSIWNAGTAAGGHGPSYNLPWGQGNSTYVPPSMWKAAGLMPGGPGPGYGGVSAGGGGSHRPVLAGEPPTHPHSDPNASPHHDPHGGLGCVDEYIFGDDALSWLSSGGRYYAGGPLADLEAWAQGAPDFRAWAIQQGRGFTGLLDAAGALVPEAWWREAKAFPTQMAFMAKRWPNGMAYLKAAVQSAPRGL